MTDWATLQHQMDDAFDNYFALSEVLREDLSALLDAEFDSQSSQRNFIRASAAMIEGYTHCIREMCLVGLQCDAPALTSKEIAALKPERGVDTNDRYKLTVRAAYKMFELSPLPDFGGEHWVRAKEVLNKRHLLMHPKLPSDLAIASPTWPAIKDDVAWLMQQLFAFFVLLQKKHAG
ncbi:MAG TPA: hypothetical protein PLB41_04465 [Rubrivivax sp.]|nr:hypothetical protein [Rubrivivax sp.]